MAVFINQPGNNVFTGSDGEYDQVDYDGSLSDYVFTRNDDGTVTVMHPTLGTDTLSSIEGFWFNGEAAWYSLDQAIELTNGNMNPVVFGTIGNDNLVGSAINNTFIASQGNDMIDGNGGAYNQVDYQGALSDYQITQNADGTVSVSHAFLGTDILTDIDGFWFSGEAAWYSIADAIALTSNDDFAGTAATTGTITANGGTAAGIIETRGDDDWFSIEGQAGQTIRFSIDAASSLIGLRVFDAAGNQLESSVVAGPTGAPGNGDVFFTIPDDGDYFVAAAGLSFRTGVGLGEYVVTAENVVDDFGNTIAEAATGLAVDGGTLNGAIDTPDDEDVFVLNVESGQSLDITLDGDFFGWAQLLDADGNVLQNPFGTEPYEVTEDGQLFVRVQSLGGSPYTIDDDWGDYTLNVVDLNAAEPINGTPEADGLFGTPGDDVINGFGGNDGIQGFGGADQINGGAGNDVIQAGGGDDTVFGGAGDDWILGEFFDQDNTTTESENDTLRGGEGNDTIDGQRGDDMVFGDAGDDFLNGGFGNDQVFGGDGNDTLAGGTDLGADFMDGGAGTDTVSYSGQGTAITLDGAGNGFDGAQGDRIVNVEILEGTRFDDTIESSGNMTRVDGGAGNDTLIASSGDGVIVSFRGGEGNDTFIAGDNVNEDFFGEGGADTFIITPGSGRVQITQFDPASGDTIDISAFGFEDFGQLNIIVTRGGTTLDLGNGDSISFNQFGGTLTASDFGLPEAPAQPFIEGTTGNDVLIGSNINNVFFGDAGDDIIDGNGGDYNQADYFGSINDYAIFMNTDGTVTVDHAEGTDTLTDIDGFWFGGDAQWYSLQDAIDATADDFLV